MMMQVVLGWFFGDSEPKNLPMPLLVGGHMGHQYQLCNFWRAFVSGAPAAISLAETDVKQSPPRFGSKKCVHADGPARWVHLKNDACAPPLCTGDRRETVNAMDWVSFFGFAYVFLRYNLLLLHESVHSLDLLCKYRNHWHQ